MGLFKRFSDGITGKNSKADLESFKSHLKYGDDPMEHWKASNEAYTLYRDEKKVVENLLRKIYNPKEHESMSNYSTMEINMWSHKGKCKKSPIGEHVYVHHYGDKNPMKGKDVCMCCDKSI